MRTFSLFSAALGAATLAASVASAAPPEELVTELMPVVETGLASSDVAVQSWAIQAGALLDSDTVDDAIVAALENVNAPIRISAARALLGMDEETDEAMALLTREVVEGDAATRSLLLNDVLIALGEDVREEVLEDALDTATDATVIREIVTHLARRAEGDVYALLERVTDIDDAEARAVYVDAVRTADRPIGVSIASELLDSRDAAQRLEGAEIAFAINNADARALLEPLLESDNAELAQRVGFHLAAYGNAAALSRTADLARNPEMDDALRMDAMALLRDNAAQLVSWADLQTVLEEEGHTPEFTIRVYELAAATQDPAAIDAVRGQLDGLFADERLIGVSAYGYSGQMDAIDTLAEVLGGSGDLQLRLRAAESLGQLGGDLAAQALIDALRAERVDEVKVAIVSALGETGSNLATQPIANTFALRNAEIALAALESLTKLGDASVAQQVEGAAVAFREPEVRWAATVTLTRLDPEAGRIRLIQALDRPPAGFREQIADLPEALLEEVDVELLRHADTTVREAALFRVMTAPDRGYSVLRPLVTSGGVSPDVRRQAISVVVAAGLPEDVDIFETLAEDTDRSIRLQGFAALARLGEAEREEEFRGYLNHADVALRLIATYGILRAHADA